MMTDVMMIIEDDDDEKNVFDTASRMYVMLKADWSDGRM